MAKINVELPFNTGDCVVIESDGLKHIDQIEEYIITKEGNFVVLKHDAFQDPRLSARIPLDEFEKKWSFFDITNEDNIKELLTNNLEVIQEKIMLDIKSVLENIPNINDTYQFHGIITDDYKTILENYGCSVERMDFGIEHTIIRRINLVELPSSKMEDDMVAKNNAKTINLKK